MKRFETEAGVHPLGLVVVFPPTVSGLFNPSVHRLVREVERRLDSTFVTYALSSGGSPEVGDAIAAARFAGCESAVVIHLEEWLDSGIEVDPATDTIWGEVADPVGVGLAAESVVSAFNGLRVRSEMAA